MRLALLIVVCARSALGIGAKDGGKDPMNLPRVREAAERARARLGLATAREALDLALAEGRRLGGTGSGSIVCPTGKVFTSSNGASTTVDAVTCCDSPRHLRIW